MEAADQMEAALVAGLAKERTTEFLEDEGDEGGEERRFGILAVRSQQGRRFACGKPPKRRRPRKRRS